MVEMTQCGDYPATHVRKKYPSLYCLTVYGPSETCRNAPPAIEMTINEEYQCTGKLPVSEKNIYH
jgi:hypothetical protein